MKFLGLSKIIVLGFCAGVQFGSCKERSPASLKGESVSRLSYDFEQEVIPYNRIPLANLKADEAIFRRNSWPLPERTQNVQTYGGLEYGIRVIQEEDLAKYVRPGDIAVDYTPISDPKGLVFESKIMTANAKVENSAKPDQGEIGLNHMILVGLGEKGMSHAKLVVNRDGELCHIDSPDVMSDCKWESFTHFFRVEADQSVRDKVALISELLMSRTSAYAYDAFLYTDVYVKGVPAVQKMVNQFEKSLTKSLPAFYCSELPFTIYSLALGRNMIDTNFNLMDFAKQISDLRSEPKFAPFVNEEVMQQSLSAFVQQASTVPENLRPMLTTGIKQLLADGYVGSGMRYLVKQYYPSLVLPQHFMLAAVNPEKVPGLRIVYIGSMEFKGIKKDKAYYSSLIIETGKAAIKNYMQRVRDWWSSPASSDDLNLRDFDVEKIKPTYLEPDYSH